MFTNWLNMTDEEFEERVRQVAWNLAFDAALARGVDPGRYADLFREDYVETALDFAAACLAVAEAEEAAPNN